ncbi:vWA domain-containing protein [Nocardia shimofusensis]|uniref:vWA domain-containing protein n=1 Tax=Nocardia shimofusensis TaxID=228596 RepID=UPI0008348F26|nr:VWA domain-containing protein [Nocardia shimofusensis]
MLRKYGRAVSALIAGALGVVLAAVPVAAVPEQTQYAPTMIVLDASGSMLRSDPSGTMMDAAKNAVRSFVESAPEQSRVGLAAYGTGTSNDEADKLAGCSDVKILHEPEPLDRAALVGAVDGIRASGWTPVGVALRQAAQVLPDSGPRAVVLVSDGEDTCAPPDPCEVARELEAGGVDLAVHAIGFAVDEKARAQLSCLADATGGSYTDAADGPALERTLPRVTAAALRSYQVTGLPVTGGTDYTTAPVLDPGHHLDTIGKGETRWYAVDVPAGATAYTTGIISFPRVSGVSILDDFNSVQRRIYGRDGHDCHEFDSALSTSSSDGETLTIVKAWRGATEEVKGDGRAADNCRGGGLYYFAFTWEKTSEKMPQRLPFEVLIGIEPEVIDPGPEHTDTPTAMVEPAGPAVPVVGGGSFTAAPTLPGSGRYTDVLRRGEIVFYRVRLDWGQGLAYRVHFSGTDGGTSNIRTELYSPLAEDLAMHTTAFLGEEDSLPRSGDPISTAPVRYDNRTGDFDLRKQSVAGWYYIAVKVGVNSGLRAGSPVTVTIDLTVAGDPEPGPTYMNAIDSGVFGETGGPRAPSAAPDDPAPVAQDQPGESSALPIVAAVLGAGAFVAVLIGAGVWYLIRRRGAGSPLPPR